MEFFDDGYYSEDDQAKEEQVEEITDDKPLIKEHWLRADSDDDDEYAGGAMTKDEESLSKIKTLAFDFACKVETANWKGSRKVFADLSRAVALHKQRYKMVPESFLDCLEESLDTAKQIQENGEIDVFDGDGETGKTVAVDVKGAKFIITQLTQALEQYSDDIARMGEEDEEDEEEESGAALQKEDDDTVNDESSVEKSFEDYALLAVRTASEKDSKLKVWRDIIAGCKKNNNTAITIYALCRAAEAVIQESRQFIISMSEWRAAYAYIKNAFVLLSANSSIRLVETGDEITPRRVPMHGGLCRHIQNLHTHLGYMTMLNEAGYQLEQLEIPVCEHMIVDLTSALLMYYQTISFTPGVVSSCRILINVLSPRPQVAHTILYPMMVLQQNQAQTSKTEPTVTESVLESVTTLYRAILRLGGREDKMRAVCCLAYQLALSGKYREGLDTIRRSGVWSYIYPEDGNVNRPLSILYNRAVVQLGLVSFYAGDVQTSYELLGPFWSMSEPELLIGQAMPRRFYMLAPETQLDYRDSLVPMHWRISKQNIELAAMLVALIVDSKREAETPYARSRHQQYFYQVIKRKYQSFGESAQLHDQIATAYNALRTGNFAEVKKVVEGMPAWDSVPNRDEVLARYIRHLQEASLTIFCYVNRCKFSTFSVEQLSIKYDLDAQAVRNVINQIIADHKTVIAYWDQNDSYLYVDRNNLTELQHIIKATAESAYALAPFTERREAVPRRT